MGYTVVKGLGSGERAAAGWIWATHQKLSCRRSVLANEMQGVAWVCQGGCLGVGERAVKVVEVHDRMARKGGVHLGSLPKPSHRGSISADDRGGGARILMERTWEEWGKVSWR